MPPIRPTLRSLAAEAGVSIATMSYALRNSPEVSLSMRKRLQQIAHLRGYRPDPQISKLMTHLRIYGPAPTATNICGLAHGWPALPEPNTYAADLQNGLNTRARSLGYTLTIINIDEYPRPGHLEKVLISRGIEGLLLLPMSKPVDLSLLLDWNKFSTVSVSPSVTKPKFHCVEPSHFDNMLLAGQHLHAAGYRRISLAMSREWDLRVKHRWTGGIAWQNLFGGNEPIKPLITHQPGDKLDPGAFAKWMAKERPDALVYESVDRDMIAQALVNIPERRRPTLVTMSWPNLLADCGIDQRPEYIGAVAVETLAMLLSRGENGIPQLPRRTVVEGRWVAGSRESGVV